MLRGQPVVEAHTRSFTVVRAVVHAGQRRQRGQVWTEVEYLDLVHVFIVEEKKRLVLLDRTAQPESRVAAGKERIRRQGAAPQMRKRGHIMIAEEIVSAAVKVVAPRAGHHIDRA